MVTRAHARKRQLGGGSCQRARARMRAPMQARGHAWDPGAPHLAVDEAQQVGDAVVGARDERRRGGGGRVLGL